MQWTLTRKIAALSLVYLVLMGGLTLVIVDNTLANQRVGAYVNTHLVEETRLIGDYNVHLQRWMTEIVAYAYSGDAEEYEEAGEELEELQEILATLEALQQPHMPDGLEAPKYLETADPVYAEEAQPDRINQGLLSEQRSMLDQAWQVWLDAGTDVAFSSASGPADSASNRVREIVEEMEDTRAALAKRSAAHLRDLHAQADEQIAARSQATLASIGGGMAGMVLLTLVMLGLAGRQVVHPVKLLASAAESVAQGNLHAMVAVGNRDEIGTLQQSFNTMVATLGQQTQALANQNTLLQTAHDEAEAARQAAELGRQEAELARTQAEAARTQVAEQLELIQTQQEALRELSTPLLPLADDVLALPLVGTIDTRRAQQVMDTLLEGIATQQARIAIIDITGVQAVDTEVANALIRTAQAVKLLGAQVVLTGIRPQIAQTLVQLGVDLRTITTHSTLQAGITHALARPHRLAAC